MQFCMSCTVSIAAIEHQEKRYGVLSSVSDTVQENLDKMRLECKNALYECEKLSNEVKEAERKRREFLLMFSNRDSEQKTRLSQIRSVIWLFYGSLCYIAFPFVLSVF